jgi:hypothetical protein
MGNKCMIDAKQSLKRLKASFETMNEYTSTRNTPLTELLCSKAASDSILGFKALL